MKVRSFLFYILLYTMVKLWQRTAYFRELFFMSNCRFYPSCSEYFLNAIQQHGLSKGIWLSLKRFLRCSPICEGGIDKVSVRSHGS